MKHNKLKQTHKKLTILFTGLVFGVVCILGLSTLTAKYYNEHRMQRAEFRKSSDEIEKILESGNIVLQTFFLNQIQERRKFTERMGREKNMLQNGKPFLSFFILDENNDIVFENIVERIDFGNLKLPEDEDIHSSSKVWYKAADLEGPYGKKVIFYTSIRYDLDDFLRDIGMLLSFIALFSAFFYFLGYRFVERALKPVEENLADMQDFIHNAGHELKTPLALMRGNLQIMQAEGKLDEKLIKQSIREVDHINMLIESLRELSEVGKLAEKEALYLSIEVKKAVAELEIFAQEKNITLENHVKGDFILQANRQELHLVLSNLVKNAIKYNKTGGLVVLSFEKNILSIRDTGIGIAPQEQEKIFERFYQAHKVRSEEGFGIGLSLVKKIADANNWRIELESDLGKGTKFYVIF